MLHNLMEDVVKELMDEVLKAQPEICACEDCKLDIMAMALNKLPPKYVVHSKGTIYSKTNMLLQQFRIDVISAITQAAILVSKNPRH